MNACVACVIDHDRVGRSTPTMARVALSYGDTLLTDQDVALLER